MSSTARGVRTVMALLDLAAVGLLAGLLRRRGRPPGLSPGRPFCSRSPASSGPGAHLAIGGVGPVRVVDRRTPRCRLITSMSRAFRIGFVA